VKKYIFVNKYYIFFFLVETARATGRLARTYLPVYHGIRDRWCVFTLFSFSFLFFFFNGAWIVPCQSLAAGLPPCLTILVVVNFLFLLLYAFSLSCCRNVMGHGLRKAEKVRKTEGKRAAFSLPSERRKMREEMRLRRERISAIALDVVA